MPTVNFYLKRPEGEPARSLVYLQMHYHGEKFVYSTKFNVDPKNWDKKKQCLKTRSQTTEDGSVNLNDLLKNLKEVCMNAYNKEMAGGVPTNQALKVHMDEYMYRNVRKSDKARKDPGLFDLIDRFISGEIGDKKTESTIKSYRTAKKHLQAFEKHASFPVNFSSITLEFKFAYVNYLKKEKIDVRNGVKKIKGLNANSIGKEIKNVRTFMNMAVELGYTTNLAFKSKKFGVKGEETDAVYLSENELRDLYKFDFSDNKRLEAVRDLFVFSSFVGLRYSDASNIKPENIVKMDREFFIKLIPLKNISTGRPVTIPCNDIVLDIFKKYEHNKNRLPPSISNQKYNEYLKDLCEKAGLVEIGRLSSDLNKPLAECISSHTARRNFATNCYLAGMDPLMIMPVTGHSTEKSFLKYIKVSREENAKRMSEHMKKDLSKKMLKAVG